MPILEVEHLNKTFAGNSGEEFHALTDVSFSIEEGECMGLIGESGSGKSTSANIVAGFTQGLGIVASGIISWIIGLAALFATLLYFKKKAAN